MGNLNLIIIFTQICETASEGTFEDKTFDSYANGSSMYGQGGWIGWWNNPSVTAFVAQDQFFSSA